MAERESSLTFRRGLALLHAVADVDSGSVTISELAEAVGVSRAAVYRLLVPLAEHSLVWRDGTKVRLGLGLLGLAERVFPQLRYIAAPALRELAESVGATAHLSVARGAEMQAVAVVEPSWTSFHVAYRVGSTHPIGVGAAGKAVDLPRGQRWASSEGELESGASGVAAPILDIPGLHASVGVVSLQPLDIDAVGPSVVEAAAIIAEGLEVTSP